ncbi:hepcidin-like [Morone saxatilis]|uniref:hepcidin-like n=1 Tax=Morone saxatilis TaxID=34816 RepID=UPI0015E1DE70|nr:hepcidin-like [Morone saxatilis]
MKTFSVVVAVAVVLAFICLQESSAVPVTELKELEEAISNDSASQEETSVETWMMPYNVRQSPIRCRYCCGCCELDVCGMCCN